MGCASSNTAIPYYLEGLRREPEDSRCNLAMGRRELCLLQLRLPKSGWRCSKSIRLCCAAGTICASDMSRCSTFAGGRRFGCFEGFPTGTPFHQGWSA